MKFSGTPYYGPTGPTMITLASPQIGEAGVAREAKTTHPAVDKLRQGSCEIACISLQHKKTQTRGDKRKK